MTDIDTTTPRPARRPEQPQISYAQACGWGAIAVDEDLQKYAETAYGPGIVAAGERQAAALRSLASLIAGEQFAPPWILEINGESFATESGIAVLTALQAGFPVPGVPAPAGEVGNR